LWGQFDNNFLKLKKMEKMKNCWVAYDQQFGMKIIPQATPYMSETEARETFERYSDSPLYLNLRVIRRLKEPIGSIVAETILEK